MTSKYKGLSTLEVLEGADNYNDWIAERIRPYIKSPALEVGAGTGNITSKYANLELLVATDIDNYLTEILRKKFSSKKNISAETLDISGNLSSIKSSFNTVYSVNVLEHIKDDQKALKNMYGLLNKGGKVILLVPAKKKAYSLLDKKLGHYRRYEKEDLRAKLEMANFSIDEIEYFNVVGLLSWLLRNKVTRNHNQLKKSHVKLFDSVVPLLRAIEPKRGLPSGISLIAVATKK